MIFTCISGQLRVWSSEQRVPLASANDPKSARLCSLVDFSVGSCTDFEVWMAHISIDMSSVFCKFDNKAVRIQSGHVRRIPCSYPMQWSGSMTTPISSFAITSSL